MFNKIHYGSKYANLLTPFKNKSPVNRYDFIIIGIFTSVNN